MSSAIPDRDSSPDAGKVAAGAASPAWPPTRRCVARPTRDYEGFWARLARELLSWQDAVHEHAR